MKKNVIFLFALAALLLFAGGRTAHALSTEPYVTWDPQSVQYPVGADAEYSATVSGKNLEFTWCVEYGGKEYEIPKDMDALMNAGMKNDCDGITVQSTANRTSIIFKNIKIGIGISNGKPTRVYCCAFDGNTGVNTCYAHVGCSGLGLVDCGYPPKVYVRPVVNLKADDTGKIGVKVIDVDYSFVDDISYQWYTYKGGPYSTGIKAIEGEDSSVYISATSPGGFEDLVVGIRFVTKGGSDYWIYSSPINVNRLTDKVDYSWDQLRIVKGPDRTGYTLGDKPDLTGLEVEYIAGGKSQGIVPVSSLETDITKFTYAGPVWVTVGYKGQTNGFTVWVDPKDGSWEIDPTSEVPTTEESTTAEAATAEAPTTAEEPTQPNTAEAPETQPETAEAPETQPETTESTQPETTAAEETTKAPETEAPSTAAPVQTTEAAPQGGGGGNTVLIILIIVMALIIGLLAGILMSKKKSK